MLKDIAMDLLSKGFRISVTTLSLSPKLGRNILRWCSYGMTLKKGNSLSTWVLLFLGSTAKCSGQHKDPFLRHGHILVHSVCMPLVCFL